MSVFLIVLILYDRNDNNGDEGGGDGGKKNRANMDLGERNIHFKSLLVLQYSTALLILRQYFL